MTREHRRKRKTSYTLSEEVLDLLETWAYQLGVTKSALIELAMRRFVEEENRRQR